MADESLEKKPEAAADDAAGDDWTAALEEQNNAANAPAAFDELDDGVAANDEGSQNLDFLLDIPLKVTVELGKTTMIINDMLQLSQG